MWLLESAWLLHLCNNQAVDDFAVVLLNKQSCVQGPYDLGSVVKSAQSRPVQGGIVKDGFALVFGLSLCSKDICSIRILGSRRLKGTALFVPVHACIGLI